MCVVACRGGASGLSVKWGAWSRERTADSLRFQDQSEKGCSYSASHARIRVVFIILYKKRSVCGSACVCASACARWLWERKPKYSHIQSRFKVKLGLSTLKQASLSLRICRNKPFEKMGEISTRVAFMLGTTKIEMVHPHTANRGKNTVSSHTFVQKKRG